VDVEDLEKHTTNRRSMIERYRNAYRHYCWTVNDISDLRVAPFHVLASEGRVHLDRDHIWHMEVAEELARADAENAAILVNTPHRLVDLSDTESVAAAVDWWTSLTGAGGEGMVVKPREFIVRGRRGLVQPAIKCRGQDYLRIIYGPEYTDPKHLERLRQRGLSRKRALAVREFALGIEALNRFVQRDALFRVHECVFAVLALESEEVDPRL
jgi:protein phosphatase